MKVPLSWIKEYVDVTEDIDTLCRKMVNISTCCRIRQDFCRIGNTQLGNLQVCDIDRVVDIQHYCPSRIVNLCPR